jgi:hypothetical protein
MGQSTGFTRLRLCAVRGRLRAFLRVATPGTVVRMPANVPHALEATARTKMLLVMLRSSDA